MLLKKKTNYALKHYLIKIYTSVFWIVLCKGKYMTCTLLSQSKRLFCGPNYKMWYYISFWGKSETPSYSHGAICYFLNFILTKDAPYYILTEIASFFYKSASEKSMFCIVIFNNFKTFF